MLLKKGGRRFVVGAKSLELVQPGNGAFDHPTGLAEAAAMLGVVACDLGGNPAIGERSTNRIPPSASRLPIGLRPRCRFRRRFGGGNSGSITAHKSSSTSGRGISCLLAVYEDTTECRTDFSFC